MLDVVHEICGESSTRIHLIALLIAMSTETKMDMIQDPYMLGGLPYKFITVLSSQSGTLPQVLGYELIWQILSEVVNAMHHSSIISPQQKWLLTLTLI